jgi:hypothetical protein
MSTTDAPTQPNKGSQGEFFAVDWRCVEEATRYGDGTNTAVAYIVLARFTRRNQSHTIAGMTAIHTRTGLSRGRADLALKTLERAGLISAPTKGTKRVLLRWANVQAARTGLTAKQDAVLTRVLDKKAPMTSGTDPDYQTAYSLIAKGILETTNAPAGKPKFQLASPDWVWLPNALVDGFGKGDSPLARLRQIRDPRAILLLLDCYRLPNLAEDGGLPWKMVRQTFKRHKIYTHGHFTIWGFAESTEDAQWDPLFTRFKPGKANADGTDAASKDLWSVWGALRAAGLVEYVGHIVEGLEDGSQAIHAYALPNQGEEEERQVALAAHEAGRAMLTKVNLEIARVALGAEPWLCPVRSHVTSVELVGIARVVHRPHTRRTSAWARNFLHQCEGHRALLRPCGEKYAKSAA